MSLGPLRMELSTLPSDPAVIKEMREELLLDAKTLPKGSDARVILHMIAGFLRGSEEDGNYDVS